MTNGYAMTLPHVVRHTPTPGMYYGFSIDKSGNYKDPICREFDLPAVLVNGQIETDQHSMRHGMMTDAQHRRAMQKRYPGAVIIATFGNGNLTANFGFVFWHNGHLYCLAGEDATSSRYTCVVSRKDGLVTIEQIWFVREFGEIGVLRKHNGGAEEITSDIDFVTSGQPLVRHGRRVALDQIVEKFYDTRHLISPIRAQVNKTALFLFNAQLQKGLLRKAVDGPVRVALEAQLDEATILPLTTNGWLKMAETQPEALNMIASFLRQHGLLTEGESLDEPRVLVRVAGKTEQLLTKALHESGYRIVENLGPLKEGDACFVNGHMEIYFRKAIYPHNIFACWPDGSTGVVVFPGKSGREGTTLPDAQRYLTEVLGVENAVLLDNGGDVRLTYRGSELVRSSEKRPQIRAMLALMATPGACVSGAVHVQ